MAKFNAVLVLVGSLTAWASAAEAQVVWTGDMEEGSLADWSVNGGGGMFNSGQYESVASQDVAHSGRYSLRARIWAPPESGVRAFRWNEPRANRDLYYSAWFYFPVQHTTTGGPYLYWNIFQFKSRSTGGRNDPLWGFYLDPNGSGGHKVRAGWGWGGTVVSGPYSTSNVSGKNYSQSVVSSVPVARWVHFECFLRQSKDFDGRVTFWQDGVQLFDFQNVRTSYDNPSYNSWRCGNEWSLNNYSDGLNPDPATIYVDDAVLSRSRVWTGSGPAPGALQLSAASYSVNEGSAQATITVTRTGGSSGAVSVSYATSNGTATAGGDYTARSGTLSWTAGDAASKTFSIPVTDDFSVEGSETVNLSLSSPTGGATIGSPSSAVLTIADNDSLPILTIAATDAGASEPGTNAGLFTLSRTGSTASSLNVTLNISGTAVNGTDYATLPGSVTIPSGQAWTTLAVTVQDDSAVEANESVVVAVAATSSYTVGTPGSATVTIADNDVPPPAAPFGPSATAVSSSQVNLAWTDNSGNETGFKIERKTGAGGTYSQIATVGANATAFSNTGLSASTTYFYRVRATGPGGDSAASNEAVATTPSSGPDSDGDGLPDAWETQHFGNLSQTASGDPDGDAFINAQEFTAGTNPTLSDTDGDGLTDGEEAATTNTDPLVSDSDADGMGDGVEVGFGFDPLNADQDANSRDDGQDDWDGDGTINQLDPTPGSVPSSGGPPVPADDDDEDRCGALGLEGLLLAALLRRMRRRRA